MEEKNTPEIEKENNKNDKETIKKEKAKGDNNKEATQIQQTKEESQKKEEKKGIFKKKEDQELKKFKEENAMLKDKFLRANAEMQNMRRRMEEEKANSLKYEGEELIKKLLPIIDNFESAISMDDTNLEDEVSKFLSGFKMIYDNLIEILKSKGVAEIDALNKPFDPSIMNGVATEINNDVEEGTVLDVLQKGYMYNDKILRPAMVKVSEKDNEAQ